MFELIKTKGSIVHVVDRLKGMNRSGSAASRVAYYLAERQRKRGFDVSIVMPWRRDIHVGLDYSEVSDFCRRYEIDGMPVYVIKPPSSSDGGKTGRDGYEFFSKSFWTLMGDPRFFKRVAIVHGHDMIAGPLFALVPESLKGVSTVFTPYRVHRVSWETQLGLSLANTVAVWTQGDWKAIQKKRHDRLLKMIENNVALRLMSASSLTLRQTRMSRRLYRELEANLCEAYLRALYSYGYEFSANVQNNPYRPSAALINVTERQSPEMGWMRAVIERDLSRTSKWGDIIVVKKGRPIGVEGFRGDLGGILQLLGRTLELGKEEGRAYLGILSGGRASRLSVVSLAAGGVKGQVRFIDQSLNELTMKQASVLMQQLPDYGRGWTMLTSCDNILVPYGPAMVGNSFLGGAKQKIILFTRKIRIRGAHRSDVNYLKNLATILTDTKTGSLKELYLRKKDPYDDEYDLEFILSRLNKLGGDYAYKGFLYVAVTNDIAELMKRLYCAPSKKDGRPMHETYELGFDSHVMDAMTCRKEEWMERYSLRNVEEGEQVVEKYNIDDWDYIWEAAQQVKNAAGGIGIAALDEGTVWADVGTLKELVRMQLEAVRGGPVKQPLRRLLGIGQGDDIVDSNVSGVKLPQPERIGNRLENPFIIKHSVFRKGGRVGRNCIIVDSVFEEYADIPDNTIIIGSHIRHTASPRAEDNQDKLIYMYEGSVSEPLKFSGGLAQATLHMIGGKSCNASMPVRIEQDVQRIVGDDIHQDYEKDPVLGHYRLDGRMADQTIYGATGSFNEMKTMMSTKLSSIRYSDLMNYIDVLLKERSSVKKAQPKKI